MTNRIAQEIEWLLNRFCELKNGSYIYDDEKYCIIKDLEYYAKYFVQDRDKYLSSIQKLNDVGIEQVHVNHVVANINRIIKTEIVVDFIISRRTSWNSAKPLIDAFTNEGCLVRIIPIPMLQELQDEYGKSLTRIIESEGYNTMDFHTYNIEEELPDLVVDNMAVDAAKIPEFRFLRIHNLIGNTVHLEHSILTGYAEAMKVSHFRIARTRSWQYLVPSDYFSKALPLVFRIDGECLAEGNPEIDTVIRVNKTKKKCRKKVVLWNIDALDPNEHKNGDIERLFREIDYLEITSEKFPEMRNIVRFHPNVINQTKCLPVVKRIRKLVDSRDNIVLDDNIMIYDTYKECDAMITWMSSTTVFTFMATGKPIALLPTFIENGYDTILDMSFMSSIDLLYNIENVNSFFYNLRDGVDPNKKKRLKTIKEYVKYINGGASKSIVRKILEKYDKRC